MFAGFLGVMYFIIFRRVWLVEDPLPMPGFEATLKMLDISSDVSTGSADAARDSLRTVGVWTVLTMGIMFVIDYPVRWSKKLAGAPSSIADWFAMTLSGEKWGLASIYTERWIHQPSELVEGKYAPYNGITPYEEGNPMSYTFLGVEISPTLFAIGWFMKFRAALLVNLGQSSHGSGLSPSQFFRTSRFTIQSRAFTGTSQRWAPSYNGRPLAR